LDVWIADEEGNCTQLTPMDDNGRWECYEGLTLEPNKTYTINLRAAAKIMQRAEYDLAAWSREYHYG
jgi:hypothetical protein|tara:strand:- start:2170 stop:2370 length:201 start_codon:yes stop_codon:yes gene_type:complete